MMALPNSALDLTYWLPWYNNVDLDTQLRFANVSGSTATVHVYVNGVEMVGSPFTLAAGASTRVSFVGVNNGPVKVVSDQNIVAAERVIYKINGVNTSFSEMMALPNSALDMTYWLPWYNNVDLDTQLRFANVSGSTATVHVYVNGAEMVGSPFTLAAGASTRQSFVGINNGPVQIVSDVNIVAAERVIYKVNGVNTSYSEMMALPNSQLNTTYWLPWYNNVDLDTQLRFANVSGSTATVHVYVNGVEMVGSPFTLAAGASTRQSFVGINNGPVQIVSDVNIVAAERVIYKINGINTSFTEVMALPNSALDTSYWLPWYNNVDLDTQLRFGVP
jgi:Tfp pilus assembly protein PilP